MSYKTTPDKAQPETLLIPLKICKLLNSKLGYNFPQALTKQTQLLGNLVEENV